MRKAHKRVVRLGTEHRGDDGSLEPKTVYVQDPETQEELLSKASDDDQRILTELPPHWAVFNAREQQ